MLVWRKMEKISWRDMKTNEEVLQMVQEEISLIDVIWRRKKNWIGRKPSEGGDRGSDDRKKTKGKETIGYAVRVSERIVLCGTKKKGRKQERVENMEAKNLPHGRTLTPTTCMYVFTYLTLPPFWGTNHTH